MKKSILPHSLYQLEYQMNKVTIYELFCLLMDQDQITEYESITRKKMISNIISFYTTQEENIISVCTYEEIVVLQELVANKKIKITYNLGDYFKIKDEKEILDSLCRKMLVINVGQARTDIYVLPEEVEVAITNIVKTVDIEQLKKENRILTIMKAMMKLYGIIEKEDFYLMLCTHINGISKDKFQNILLTKLLLEYKCYFLEIEFHDETRTFITDYRIDEQYLKENDLIFEIPYNELSEMELMSVLEHDINMNHTVIIKNLEFIEEYTTDLLLYEVKEKIWNCANLDSDPEELLCELYDCFDFSYHIMGRITGKMFLEIVQKATEIAANTYSWRFRGYSLNEVNELVDMANEEVQEKQNIHQKRKKSTGKDDIIKIDFKNT